MSSAESPPQDLGRAEIDPETNRVPVPEDLDEWEVLSPGGDAYWAYDTETDRLVVTRSQRALDEHADLNRVGSTRVTDDGEAELPETVTEDGGAEPWSGTFEPGDTCYFDAPGDVLAEQLCYALTDDQHETFWND